MAKRFEVAINIISSIKDTTERVHTSPHQCRRLRDRLNHVSRAITMKMETNGRSGVDNQASASLLSVLRKSERLVTECTAADWASDVLVRPGRKEDFEEIHQDLSLCTTSLLLAEEPHLWRLKILASDARLDGAELLRQTLQFSSTSFQTMAENLDNLTVTVTEMLDANVCRDCEMLVDDVDITHLPSYVQITPAAFRDERYQGSGDYGEVTKATWFQERRVEWRVDLNKPCPDDFRRELIRWMAPEVYSRVEGNDIMHYSAMSNIYSFGVLCSEVLTGKFPFEDVKDVAEVRARVLAGERPVLPDTVEPDLEQLINDCWRGDYTLRPTASQIIERLERIMFHVPINTLGVISADNSDSAPDSNEDDLNDVADGQSETGKALERKLSLPPFLRIPESDIKIIRELGKGGFACVYKAEWQGSRCAVKRLIGKANISELQREVEILMKLRHPHIVELMGFSVSPCSIVMELMTEDLPALYKRRAPGPPFQYATALTIIKQIASGMAYLHSFNILHRDLKGANVLVQGHDDDIVAKIADFGVSRCTHGRSVSDCTGSGFWRPPELLRAMKERVPFEYTTKGDIYSFAMTPYEILTGKKPFEDYLYSDEDDGMEGRKIRYSQREVMEMLVNPAGNSPIPRRPELPEGDGVNLELLHLIEDCWNEVPEIRPSFQVITDRLQRMRQK